jgi:hypothetical protein
LDLHSSSNDLTGSSYAHSPLSGVTSSNSSLMANNIYTTGSAVSDALNIASNNPNAVLNGTIVNGHQVDPADLQAFESFHQGRCSNDEQFFIVIYLIDTFRYELAASINDENASDRDTGDIDERLDAYVKKAIFRAYMDLTKDLPEKISIRVNIQVRFIMKCPFVNSFASC